MVELIGTKDVRMVAKLLEHPDFVMPEGLERALPAAMAEILAQKHTEGPRQGHYVYRPRARTTAAAILMRMIQMNRDAQAAREGRGGDVNINLNVGASGDVHLAVARLQQAGLSEAELRTLAASREIVKRVEADPSAA